MNDSLMQGAWPEAASASLDSTDDASLFLLQHAGQHVHARGCRATLPAGALATLAERVSAFFARQRGGPGLLVGAVPFEPRADDALFQPERLLPALALQPQAAPPLDGSLKAEPAPQDYASAVAAAVQVLRAPELNLQKVVLARSLLARTRQALSPDVLLARLGADPSVATYAVPLPVELGQAPAAGGGDAGTAAAQARRRAVVASAGRFRAAQRRCRRGRACGAGAAGLGQGPRRAPPRGRSHRRGLGTVLQPHRCAAAPGAACHRQYVALGTRIHATLKDPQASAAELLAQLHPTPAVCGTPRLAALQRIRELEPVPRGFYAGAVGWLDAQGDGDWYVAIRCARLQGTQLRLYAGAGIVAESHPEAEVAETAAKFAALLNALGVHESAPAIEPAA